jgi:dTDP-4-amino-4,6-dideoxygalactose transaminase
MGNRSNSPPLAILGGTPRFADPIHVGRPNLGNWDSFQSRLRGIWERNWLTNDGPVVREFERTLADYLGVAHCVAVCNATVGLEITIQSLGLTGEVIVPSFTFIASAHSIRRLGLRPIFCDCDPTTHQIDPASVARVITPRTSGILGVHLWGQACPVLELEELARSRGLSLMFDAAHAFGTSAYGRRIGGFGQAEVFSFHGTKFMNSFEGGAITTNDSALAERLRLFRNFGFAGYDNVVHLGTNAKMSEVSAAMGLTSFESIDQFMARNRENQTHYRKSLGSTPGIKLITAPDLQQINAQYVVAEIDQTQLGLSRDELQAVLQAENVLVRRYFHPGCHRMAAYLAEPESTPIPLPHTEAVSERVMVFPNGMAVDRTIIAQLREIIELAVKQATEIRSHLVRPMLAASEKSS